jgi:hypothetical protein
VDRTDDPVRMYLREMAHRVPSRGGDRHRQAYRGRPQAMISARAITADARPSSGDEPQRGRSCSATSSISRRPMPAPMPRRRRNGWSRRRCRRRCRR